MEPPAGNGRRFCFAQCRRTTGQNFFGVWLGCALRYWIAARANLTPTLCHPVDRLGRQDQPGFFGAAAIGASVIGFGFQPFDFTWPEMLRGLLRDVAARSIARTRCSRVRLVRVVITG